MCSSKIPLRYTTLFTLLLCFRLSVLYALPVPELGDDAHKEDGNPIITRLLREVHDHTDYFRTLPRSLYSSVELLKRYRDSEVYHAIRLQPGSSVGQTRLAIVTPTLANAYMNLAQFRTTSPPSQVQVPSEAFGAEQWEQYFGVEVVDAPPLPTNIEAILNETAPFVLDNASGKQTVRASCMLTLIPKKIKLPGGEQVPFTLDQLGQLLLDNNKGYFGAFSKNTNTKLGDRSHGYRYYHPFLTEVNRSEPYPESPCWVLVAKDVLKDTRYKTFADQQAEVSKYTPLYSVPRVLEIATSVLGYYAANNQTRLYQVRLRGAVPGSATFTRCQELDMFNQPFGVGDFEVVGLQVDYDRVDVNDSGMSCSRKL